MHPSSLHHGIAWSKKASAMRISWSKKLLVPTAFSRLKSSPPLLLLLLLGLFHLFLRHLLNAREVLLELGLDVAQHHQRPERRVGLECTLFVHVPYPLVELVQQCLDVVLVRLERI